MRASKGARRRQRRRRARMIDTASRDPLEAKLRQSGLVQSWHAEIRRRAWRLDGPSVWDLVARIRAELGEADGAMAAVVAVKALESVIRNTRYRS